MQKRFHMLFVIVVLLPVFWEPGGTGADATLKKVRLMYQGPAKSVCVVGNFNQWSLQHDCMQGGQNGWELTLYLPPGTYRYAFFVDGQRWVIDPNALWTETDGFGRENAVLLVQ